MLVAFHTIDTDRYIPKISPFLISAYFEEVIAKAPIGMFLISFVSNWLPNRLYRSVSYGSGKLKYSVFIKCRIIIIILAYIVFFYYLFFTLFFRTRAQSQLDWWVDQRYNASPNFHSSRTLKTYTSDRKPTIFTFSADESGIEVFHIFILNYGSLAITQLIGGHNEYLVSLSLENHYVSLVVTLFTNFV